MADIWLICDRCNHSFCAQDIEVMCVPCLRANREREAQTLWGRPTTARELRFCYGRAHG